MDISRTSFDGLHVLRVHAARIDAPAALDFKERMRGLTRNLEGRIVLDLAEVDFIDSSGLGAVVACMKQMREGQSLELAALRPMVDKVFRLTRMDTVFRIHATADGLDDAQSR